MIDTHCHLTFPQLSERLSQVLAGAADAGVDQMITIGTTPADAARASAIAEAYEQVFFAAGIHPHYVTDVTLDVLPHLAELAAHPKCVAFGEMGVDYHYDDPPRKAQHDMFAAQLEVVRYSELPKPIVIHCRKAVDDTLAIINGSGIPGNRFVFHCFTEPLDDVIKVLDLGAMVSFTGITTYKNAPEVRESFQRVPMDRVMVETDSPYLSPEPHRKIRPNEPKFVVDTARYLAGLRAMKFEVFVKQVDRNARNFFSLPAPALSK